MGVGSAGQGTRQHDRAHDMAPHKRPVLDRFWEKVVVRGEDDCWLWTAATVRGYGVFGLTDGNNVMAHRFAYEIIVGPIPSGLFIDHLCRVTNCVNPRHMEPVTNGENVLRGEGLSAENARKTHCKYGHEFTEENTSRGFNKSGKPRRLCRECARRMDRERRPRNERRKLNGI